MRGKTKIDLREFDRVLVEGNKRAGKRLRFDKNLAGGIGQLIQTEAVKNAPMDTGYLRGSADYKVDASKRSVAVWFRAFSKYSGGRGKRRGKALSFDYAWWTHHGAKRKWVSKAGGKTGTRYLHRAVEENRKDIEKALKRNTLKILREEAGWSK